MGCLHTETQSLHPILPIQSCKWWVRYDFQIAFLFSFFTLYFKLIMDENTNDTLSLFCFLFLSCVFNQKQIILYNSFYMVFLHNDYPCFLIFNSNPTHIQDVFFFFLFQQQRKRLIFLFGAIEFAEKVKSLTLRINQWFNFVSLTRINPSQHLSANNKPCWTSYCED